jgi:hypothetical protein
VDSRHHAGDDAELVVQDFGKRGKAVCRARGVRDDLHLGPVLLPVDADDDRLGFGVLGRSRDDDLLRAGLEVLARRLGREHLARRLDDVLGTGRGPVELERVALREEGDFPATEYEAVVGFVEVEVGSIGETAVSRVVVDRIEPMGLYLFSTRSLHSTTAHSQRLEVGRSVVDGDNCDRRRIGG